MNYDSDTPPTNNTATQPEVACMTCGLVFGGPNLNEEERPICCTFIKAACTTCKKVCRPSKNARQGCFERSAKSNLEKHALELAKKGDEKHRALARKLRAEDCYLDNWQEGRVPPGETRNTSNWKKCTDKEWKNYIGHYNRHMSMDLEDQQKALEDNVRTMEPSRNASSD